MANLWTLGGISPKELAFRTLRASWEDAVFGQGGRMAFYHFLALFPSLLVFLTLSAHFARLETQVKDSIQFLCNSLLPSPASALFKEVIEELNQHALSGVRLSSALAGALWAAMNSTWALIYGLNRAYEVEERRSWWELALTITGLTACGTVLVGLAISLVLADIQLRLHSGLPIAGLRALKWLLLSGLALLWFAVLYRFGPNLRDHEWQWSTPGALCALTLWIASIAGARIYFEHVNNYARGYGHLNSVVMLLLWLYIASGSILIGGEMNSEIEKAAKQGRPSQHAADGRGRDRSGN